MEGSRQEFVSFHFGLKAIQGSLRRPTKHLALNGKRGGVTGTEKRVLLRNPMHSAAEMRTPRRKCNDLVIRLLHDPRNTLFTRHPPAIHLIAAAEATTGTLPPESLTPHQTPPKPHRYKPNKSSYDASQSSSILAPMLRLVFDCANTT